MRQTLIIAGTFIFYFIVGCAGENPPVVPQPNHYKWEYVYGDSSKMLITSVNVSDNDVEMIWYSFSEHNVAGYEIQYTREQYYQDLGYVNGNGTNTDTIKYSYTTKFENPDSVNFRIIMREFDGSSIFHQFIVIKL